MNVNRFLPIIGITLLLILLYHYDFSSWVDLFYHIPLPLLILSLGGSFPIVLISNVEWQYLLKKQNINVSFRYSMKNIFIGYFYGFITPGGIGGYTRAFYLKNESNETLEKCLFNIGILNTIDIISLFFISIIGAFLFSSIFPLLFLFLLIFCVIWIIFLFVFIRRKTWIWIMQMIFRFTFFKKYQEWISTSIQNLQTSLPSKKQILATLSISLFGWILRFTLFFGVIQLFLIDVSYIYVIFIISIANIIAMIPISIYGLGTRETVLISLFSVFHVSSDIIIGVSLFWFVIVWIIPSIIGAIVSLFETKHVSKQ